MTENSGDWVLRPKPTSVAAMVDPAEPPAPDQASSPRSRSETPEHRGDASPALTSLLPRPVTEAGRSPALVGGVIGLVVLVVLARALRNRR